MEQQEKNVQKFQEPSGCAYFLEFTPPIEDLYRPIYDSERISISDGKELLGQFSSFVRCLEVCKAKHGKATNIRMIKQAIDPNENSPGSWPCLISTEGEIVEIESSYEFDHMWFEFPTLFRPGDIVCSRSGFSDRDEPFILMDIPTWDEKNMRNERVNSEFDTFFLNHRDSNLAKRRKEGTVSDMFCYRTYMSDNGPTLERCEEPTECYLDLEFYRKPLEGFQRILQPVSEFYKYKLVSIEVLVNTCCYLSGRIIADKMKENR